MIVRICIYLYMIQIHRMNYRDIYIYIYVYIYIFIYIYIIFNNRSACGKVLRVTLVRWNCSVQFYRGGGLRLFCRCLPDSGAKREDFRCRNRAEKVPKTTKGDPQVCQIEPMDFPKHPLGHRFEKVTKKGAPSLFFVVSFWLNFDERYNL